MEYNVILVPEPEGGYTILMPAFPDYVGFGETEDEARQLAREGVQFELVRLRDAGRPVPSERRAPSVLQVAA